MEKITIEQANEFFDYLRGEIPEGFVGVKSPKLSPRRAFDVIYILQEHLRVLPDHYSLCCKCNQLYDNWAEGGMIGGSFYCGYIDGCYQTRRNEINYRRRELRRIKKQERLEL